MASNHLVGPFLGINNRLPDNQLAYTERGVKLGDFLRNAVNVDLTDSGTVQRRGGYALSQSGGECHSLWSDGDTGYYADGTDLYRYPRTLVAQGLSGNAVSFCRVGDFVVWSDGVRIQKIVGSNSLPLTQPDPNPMPVVVGSGGGLLAGGLYLVSFVVSGASGDSAPTWPTQISVPTNGRISITNITQPTKVYISGPNGEEMFFAETIEQNKDILARDEGALLTTKFMRPTPAGHIVRYFRGRLLSVVNDTLFYSQSFAPGLYDPVRGYIPFPAPITLVAVVQSGVFVCADKTYFLAGPDIDKAEVIEKLPYGAVPGTDTYAELDESVWWYSDRGVVRAEPDGQIANVQERHVAAGSAAVGASLFRDQDGIRQVLSSLAGSETTRAAASSFIDAEIIRKEKMR